MKGAENMGQWRGEGGMGKESNIHIPIAYRLPICQELRFMDYW